MDSGVHHPGICYTDFIRISLPSIFFDPRSTRIPPIGFLLVEFQGADHAEGAPTGYRLRLRQVEFYLKDAGMAGLESAWAMARRRPEEYRRKVDAATRCSGVCPHT